MRVSKARKVVEWLRSHPEASFAECADATGYGTYVWTAATKAGILPRRMARRRWRNRPRPPVAAQPKAKRHGHPTRNMLHEMFPFTAGFRERLDPDGLLYGWLDYEEWWSQGGKEAEDSVLGPVEERSDEVPLTEEEYGELDKEEEHGQGQ